MEGGVCRSIEDVCCLFCFVIVSRPTNQEQSSFRDVRTNSLVWERGTRSILCCFQYPQSLPRMSGGATPSEDAPVRPNKKTIENFVELVYRNYNQNPYHNFTHAVAVSCSGPGIFSKLITIFSALQ